MLKLDLQFFGGRGANYIPPERRSLTPGGTNYGIGLGERIGSLKETLGTKGKAMNPSQAVSGANPNWDDTYDSYSSNCQRCVVAYELRRRGYDVEARATYAGDKKPQVAYRKKEANGETTYYGRWLGAFKNAKVDNVGVSGNSKKAEAQVLANIESQMKKYGEGSRAVVQTFWRNGGGHVFTAEYRNGKVMFYEPQIGNDNKYAIKNVQNTIARTSTGTVHLVRTDNLRVAGKVNEFVKNAKDNSSADTTKAVRRYKIEQKTKKYKKK